MFFKSAISKDAFLRESLAGCAHTSQEQDKGMEVHLFKVYCFRK